MHVSVALVGRRCMPLIDSRDNLRTIIKVKVKHIKVFFITAITYSGLATREEGPLPVSVLHLAPRVVSTLVKVILYMKKIMKVRWWGKMKMEKCGIGG